MSVENAEEMHSVSMGNEGLGAVNVKDPQYVNMEKEGGTVPTVAALPSALMDGRNIDVKIVLGLLNNENERTFQKYR
jgi:hypothetical protein